MLWSVHKSVEGYFVNDYKLTTVCSLVIWFGSGFRSLLLPICMWAPITMVTARSCTSWPRFALLLFFSSSLNLIQVLQFAICVWICGFRNSWADIEMHLEYLSSFSNSLFCQVSPQCAGYDWYHLDIRVQLNASCIACVSRWYIIIKLIRGLHRHWVHVCTVGKSKK